MNGLGPDMTDVSTGSVTEAMQNEILYNEDVLLDVKEKQNIYTFFGNWLCPDVSWICIKSVTSTTLSMDCMCEVYDIACFMEKIIKGIVRHFSLFANLLSCQETCTGITIVLKCPLNKISI